MLGDMLKFSNALQCDVAPALVVGTLVDLDAVIVR